MSGLWSRYNPFGMISRFGSAVANSVTDLVNPSRWIVEAVGFGRNRAGKNINPETALTQSAYWACLSNISEDIAKLPIMVYRRRTDGRGKDRATNHPLYNALKTSPNSEQTSMEFVEELTRNAMAWGVGYAEIARDAMGNPRELWPIHPANVKLGKDNLGKYYDVQGSDGETVRTVRMRERDIIRIPGRCGGLSIAQYAAQTIGIAIAADEFAGNFWANNAQTGGIIEYPTKMSSEAVDNLRKSWAGRHGGSENAWKMAVLEDGVKYHPTAQPLVDSQFLESRQFQATEIARWFRIPPHKIQEMTHATFSNIEQQALEYVTDTLQPWLIRWKLELTRKLFADEPEVFAELLVNALALGDMAARGAFYRNLFYMGAISPNGIRELENMNPIESESGDKYYIQTSMTTLDAVSDSIMDETDDTDTDDDQPSENSAMIEFDKMNGDN